MKDYKEKYQEAKELVKEQKKVIAKQQKTIDRLLMQQAERKKSTLYNQGVANKKLKEQLTILRNENKKLQDEITDRDFRISNLESIVNNIGLIGKTSKPAIIHDEKPATVTQRYLPSLTSELLSCGVDRLYMREYLTKILEDAGIGSIYELVTTPIPQLLTLKDVTKDRLKKIKDTLKTFNLTLEMNVTYLPDINKYVEK